MSCTVNDIAKAAGVSRTTVLRALSEKPDISSETRDRIQKLAADMKYRPNLIARSLTRGRTNLAGVILDPGLFYSFNEIISNVDLTLRDAGYSMLLYVSGYGFGNEISFAEPLMRNRADGVIAVPNSNAMFHETYEELVESGMKLVIIDGCDENLKVPQVFADQYRAARLGTEHLISMGHKRIVHLAIPEVSYVGRERARGFRDAMAASGIPVTQSSIVHIEFDEEQAAKTAARILSEPDRPTAFLVRHDLVARGVMRGILAAGFRIPEDVSVVGSGNATGSDMFRVPLTTVRAPTKDIVDIGVQALLKLMNGHHVEATTTILDVELVTRSSTAVPSI